MTQDKKHITHINKQCTKFEHDTKPGQYLLPLGLGMRPVSYHMRKGGLLYVEHNFDHHVLREDINRYLLCRKSPPIGELVSYESTRDMQNYFNSIGYTV